MMRRFAAIWGTAIIILAAFLPQESAGFFSFDFLGGATKTKDISAPSFAGNFDAITRLAWKEYYGERRIDLALCAGDAAREKIAAAADDAEFAKLTNEALGRCLDKNSKYLTSEETADARVDRGGVGIIFEEKNRGVAVAEVLPDTPASFAGIAAGDILLELDGNPVAGVSIQEIQSAVEGKEGEPVALTIVRNNAVRVVVLMRRSIMPQSNASAWLFPEFVYAGFGESIVAGDLFFFFSALQSAEERGKRALVFDIRSSSTGVVPAVCFVGLFVNDPRYRVAAKQGAVIGNPADNFPAGLCPILGWPIGRFYRVFDKIVILVNEETAAGSEIIALAMQEQEIGAIIVGIQTAKHGAATETFSLPIGSLRLNVGTMRAGEQKRFVRDGAIPDIVSVAEKVMAKNGGNAPPDISEDLQFRDAVRALRE
jgi:carboxyl-terminal processing protease